MIIFWIIVAVLVAYLIFMYNGLVTSRNRVDEAWSDIEVQLKRRYDLIPNLVNTVKGYAKHEEGLFTKVTDARSKAMAAPTPPQKLAAENEFSQTIRSLFAVAENYPDLKANTNFLSLQSDLTDTEDKIQASRRFYNGNVRDYNTKLQTFPTNIFASMFNFTSRTFFDIDEKGPEGQPVNVQF
jgi:LemA protein